MLPTLIRKTCEKLTWGASTLTVPGMGDKPSLDKSKAGSSSAYIAKGRIIRPHLSVMMTVLRLVDAWPEDP